MRYHRNIHYFQLSSTIPIASSTRSAIDSACVPLSGFPEIYAHIHTHTYKPSTVETTKTETFAHCTPVHMHTWPDDNRDDIAAPQLTQLALIRTISSVVCNRSDVGQWYAFFCKINTRVLFIVEQCTPCACAISDESEQFSGNNTRYMRVSL